MKRTYGYLVSNAAIFCVVKQRSKVQHCMKTQRTAAKETNGQLSWTFIKTLQWLTCPHLSCANNVHVVETEWNLKWQNGNNKCTLISPSDFKPIAGIQIIGCGTSSQRAGKNKEDKRERKGRDFPAHIPQQAIRHCSCLNHLINLWFVFYQVQNTPVRVFNT